MSKEGILGSCVYCGQVITLGEKYKGASEEERNEAAKNLCDCNQANHYRRIIKSIDEAKVNIRDLFLKNYPDTCEVLEMSVSYIRDEKFASITIDNGDGTKGKVKVTQKGTIIVEKSLSRKTSREVT